MTLPQLTQMLELPRPSARLSERLSELTAQLLGAVVPLRRLPAMIDKMEEIVILSEETVAGNELLVQRLSESIQQLGRVPQLDTYPDTYLDDLGGIVELVETTFPQMIERSRGSVNQLTEAYELLSDLFESLIVRVAVSKQSIKRMVAIQEQVEQLTQRQQALAENYETHKDGWIADLLIQISRQRELTVAERLRLSDAVELAPPVQTVPSLRREDWYGDDGR